MKGILSALTPVLPYGVTESWDDLNPRLYHAIHIYWLKFYGMWYNNFSPKSILFWLQLIYTLIVLWLVCFLPGIGELVYLLRRRKDIGDISEGLYLFLSEMYAYFKLAVFWWNKDKIMKLLEYLHCEEFKPIESEHKNFVRKSIKRARMVITAFGTIVVSAISVPIIIPLAENFNILPTNVEYPYFDVYKSPAYEILYIHHIYYKPATCIIDVVMDTLLAAFVTSASMNNLAEARMVASKLISKDDYRYNYYDALSLFYSASKEESMNNLAEARMVASKLISKDDYRYNYYDALSLFYSASKEEIGQLEILAFNMRHFNIVADRRRERAIIHNQCDGNANQDYYIRTVLRDCIIHHNIIIRYVSQIENAFSLPSALQFILGVMVLCSIGIQLLSIEEPTSHPMQLIWMAVYLTCVLIEVFILCWFGDELIWKSNELTKAAYEGPWRSLNKSNVLILIMFLQRCNRPLQVTAGKIFVLSLDTYTVFINWAYKAFAVMRNMKK